MKYLNKINSPEDLKQIEAENLPLLCKEIRSFLIDSLSKTGGHLSSNLGIVELSVALHYCFASPKDKIIWDVGHQAYVHKILTGRLDKFNTLRKFKGLSGFPKSDESIHDVFEVGHSSTSISAALGFCITRDLNKESYNVISVIGDGSMTCGLAFEALNNAGRSNTNLLIILNDNQMSINENVGALSSHLNDIRTAPTYVNTKEDINRLLNKIPKLGNNIGKALEKIKESLKYLLVPGVFFEHLGFKYFGQIDGNDINKLIKIIKQTKKINGPVILHIHTKKGKGYELAEDSPDTFHGVDPFNIKTGKPLHQKPIESYSSIFGDALTDLAEKNNKIIALTAAMPSSTGLSKFQLKFPDRIFDVGIAEAHAVTFAAGASKNGYIPVVAIYSSFLQRAYDQILHDVCIQNLHVVFCLDRAGVVGSDGETHQGLFDISYLSHIPNLTIMAPKNKNELIKMLAFAVDHNGPTALRYPKGTPSNTLNDLDNEIKLGKCEYINHGFNIAILAVGSMVDIAYEVYLKLIEDGYNPTIINCRFISPIDLDMIKHLKNYNHVYVLEENVLNGGFNSLVLQQMSLHGISIYDFYAFSLPNKFIEQGSREQLLNKYKLDAKSIYNTIKLKLG